MAELPCIKTARLLLRPFTMADANDVQRLAGDRDIASTTTSIPLPYDDGVAEQWIATHHRRFEQGTGLDLAIALNPGDALVGAIGLRFEPEHDRAELGYWIGQPYWGQGYATEAARALVHYGFDTLGLHRIYARHFKRNPASGRVLQKIGMTHEGQHRQHRYTRPISVVEREGLRAWEPEPSGYQQRLELYSSSLLSRELMIRRRRNPSFRPEVLSAVTQAFPPACAARSGWCR